MAISEARLMGSCSYPFSACHFKVFFFNFLISEVIYCSFTISMKQEVDGVNSIYSIIVYLLDVCCMYLVGLGVLYYKVEIKSARGRLRQ